MLVVIAISGVARAQSLTSGPHTGVAQVPVGEDVYLFLRHLSVRGLIQKYSEAELPLSEHEIVLFLHQAEVTKLSNSEREQRDKYLRTYEREPYQAVTMFPADSADKLFFSGIPTDKDKYLYRWRDDSTLSDLQVHGIADLDVRKRDKPTSGTAELGMIGGSFTGTLSGHVGFFMQTTNGEIFGDTTVAAQDPTISQNKNFAIYTHQYFDNTSGELSYNADWFTAKIAREALSIGGSYQGNNIIISPDVQSPDFIMLGAKVGAVRYQAAVVSLLGESRWSVQADSNATISGPGADIDSKYLTFHDLTFLIGDNFELGFTDMVVYSRRLDLGYMNPFTFLKDVEGSLNDRDNGLLAVHSRWRVTDGLELRGQGLVDDINAHLIGTGFWGNKFAWQIGGMWSDPFGINDVDASFEYTRVEPFVYTHFDPQNTFATSGQILGASIGPNSISYWASLRWTPSAKLTLEGICFLVERGENTYDSTGALVINTSFGEDLHFRLRCSTAVSIILPALPRTRSKSLSGRSLSVRKHYFRTGISRRATV